MPEFDSTVEYRRIPGFDGYFAGSDGSIWSAKRGRSRKRSATRRNGYLAVNLCRDGQITKIDVHTLVLISFKGPRPDGLECRHLDGDSFNNAIGNIQWGTKAENAMDKVRHGTAGRRINALRRGRRTILRGEDYPRSKLTRELVIEIRAITCRSVRLIAKQYGVSRSTVGDIRSRKTWVHD